MNADTLADAVCAQIDPYVWFSEEGSLNATAKALCHSCPIEDACLSTALADPELSGIWGGTTPRERQRMRALAARSPRRNGARPIKHGTEGGAQAHRRHGEAACSMCKTAATDARQCRSDRVEAMAA